MSRRRFRSITRIDWTNVVVWSVILGVAFMMFVKLVSTLIEVGHQLYLKIGA